MIQDWYDTKTPKTFVELPSVWVDIKSYLIQIWNIAVPGMRIKKK